MSQEENNYSKFILHGLSGSIGAVMSVFLLFPIDNMKVRMQIGYSFMQNFILQINKVYLTNRDPKNKKLSLAQQVKKVYKEEKIIGFYKGISSTLLGNFISNFTYFLCYNSMKQYVGIQKGDQIKYIISVLISGIITSIVTNPFWAIQTAQTQNKTEQSILQTVKILKFKGLYKGLSASLVLVVNPIINYLTYENIKSLVTDDMNADSQSQSMHFLIVCFLAGALGKFLATGVTYPYQLLRTKMHIQKGKVGMFSLIKQLVQTQGFTGLYAGFKAKIVQSVLNNAFTLMFYEEIKYQITYLLKHVDQVHVVFIFKLIGVFLICLYIQSHKIKYTQIYYLFFIGFFISMFGNVIYLFQSQNYESISLGFFAIGLLFYIHSVIHNLSTKKNRHYYVYIVLAGFTLYGLVFEKILFSFTENPLSYINLMAGGLLMTLIVLSFLRFGKTSKKSYSFSIMGALCLALGGKMMYLEEKNQILDSKQQYFIVFLQLMAQVLLMLGTTSHHKYEKRLSERFEKPIIIEQKKDQ